MAVDDHWVDQCILMRDIIGHFSPPPPPPPKGIIATAHRCRDKPRPGWKGEQSADYQLTTKAMWASVKS